MDAEVFEGKLFTYLVTLHIISWITQFVGHGIYESKYPLFFYQNFSLERAPALVSNLVFVFIAPFFAVFEMVNIVSGYRQKDIDQFEKIIQADIAHYRKGRGIPMV